MIRAVLFGLFSEEHMSAAVRALTTEAQTGVVSTLSPEVQSCLCAEVSASGATARLTDEQAAFYHREGYLVVDRITDEDDIRQMSGWLMELFRRHAELPPDVAFELGAAKDDRAAQVIPQIISPSKLEPRLLGTRYWRNAQAIARQLLGPEVGFQGDHTIYKPAGNRKETPWHQDLAYYNKGATAHVVNFWLPLHDCPVENSCMWFVPHSHHGDLLPHFPAGHDPKMHTLETDALERERAVACPLTAGGATLHALKTLHYTGPNTLDRPRLAYIVAFGHEWPARGE